MTEHTSLRTSPEVLTRVDRLADALDGRLPMRASRSAVLRLVLLAGLHQVEAAASSGDPAGTLRVLSLALGLRP